jgi:hypothetical protein
MRRSVPPIAALLAAAALMPAAPASAFSLFKRDRPPKAIVRAAIRADINRGRLMFLEWELSYKIVEREKREIDGDIYHYWDYEATASITKGNKWVEVGESSDHSGTIILFKRDNKWFRVILQQ